MSFLSSDKQKLQIRIHSDLSWLSWHYWSVHIICQSGCMYFCPAYYPQGFNKDFNLPKKQDNECHGFLMRISHRLLFIMLCIFRGSSLIKVFTKKASPFLLTCLVSSAWDFSQVGHPILCLINLGVTLNNEISGHIE